MSGERTITTTTAIVMVIMTTLTKLLYLAHSTANLLLVVVRKIRIRIRIKIKVMTSLKPSLRHVRMNGGLCRQRCSAAPYSTTHTHAAEPTLHLGSCQCHGRTNKRHRSCTGVHPCQRHYDQTHSVNLVDSTGPHFGSHSTTRPGHNR